MSPPNLCSLEEQLLTDPDLSSRMFLPSFCSTHYALTRCVGGNKLFLMLPAEGSRSLTIVSAELKLRVQLNKLESKKDLFS